ncbi:MAG: phage tail tip lysozyme [Syntrophobacteraceae bacterium]|jgi:hypothetical protein
MAYDIDKVRAQGMDDQSIATYLAQQYGYDINAPLQQGASYSDIADYLAKTDPHQVAMRFFQKAGWSPEQSAGIVGNLSYESGGMKPNAKEVGGKGWGLAQWTSPERIQGLAQYAQSKGEQTPSFKTQLEYVQQELTGPYRAAGEALKKAESVGDATKVFSDLYEIPGVPNLTGRGMRAAQVLKLSGAPEAPAPSIMDRIRAGMGGEASFGDVREVPGVADMLPDTTPEDIEKYRPVARAGGMLGGAALAAPGNIIAPGVAEVAGAAGGAAISDQIMDYLKKKIIERATGKTINPTLTEALVGPSPLKEPGNYGALGAATEGAEWEMGGQAAGQVLAGGARMIGGAVKPTLGKLTGAGTGAIEEAVKSGESLKGNIFKTQTDFDKAMRGDITPQEVVENAKEALGTVKRARGQEYVSKLKEVRAYPETLDNIKTSLFDKVDELAAPERFDIGFQENPEGGYKLDFSTSPLIESRPVVKRALHDILTWDDSSAAGLDALSKRLGTYVDQTRRGSPANAFMNELKSNLSDSLKAEIPGYGEMTKGYAETTKLIKDIESNLMLRPEGLSGRITADQTLRRLSSSMKDNFELRRELVNSLSSRGGEDLAGQIAGRLMQSPIPHGLRGAVGMPAEAIAVYLKPELWPVLAASSPRVVGEFLRVYGKALSEVRGVSPQIGKALAFAFSEENRDKLKVPGTEGGRTWKIK